MKPFIPFAVSLLCLILGNEDKLAAALNDGDAAEDEQEFPSMLDIINTRWLKNERNNEDLPDSRRLVFNRDADDKYSARTIGNSNNLRQHYIIHGWKGNIYEEWVNDTSNAILSKHLDTAVIRLDWHIAADKDYIAAARIVRRSLGALLGKHIVNEYRNKKLDLDSLTLIGNGLGAHVAGIAGKIVFRELGKKVGKIIGSSPAGPTFDDVGNKKKLYKNDATCVIAVHTDQRIFGYKFPTGGLDFYINGGSHQPGCSKGLDECSHLRARVYVAEAFSKIRTEIQAARSYDDTKKFIRAIGGNCTVGNGEYEFNTRNKPPYLFSN